MSGSNCPQKCVPPPPIFDLPPPPDPSEIWNLLDIDEPFHSSLEKFDLNKCDNLQHLSPLIKFFGNLFNGFGDIFSGDDGTNSLYFLLIFIFLLIFGASTTAIFCLHRKRRTAAFKKSQQKTPSSLNSSKYSIETMATGGTTTAITTNNGNLSQTTTKKLISPPAPPPRTGNYWQQVPGARFAQPGSYRSATVSRKAFALPAQSALGNENQKHILNSQSATNIFGAVAHQKQHRNKFLLQQQTSGSCLNDRIHKCNSSTLMRRPPNGTNASILMERHNQRVSGPCLLSYQHPTWVPSRMHGDSEAYCTLSRPACEAYEEIASVPHTPQNVKNQRMLQNKDMYDLDERCSLETPTIFEDLSENLRFLENSQQQIPVGCRKPAPVIKPPPPPTLNSQISPHRKTERVESGNGSLLEDAYLKRDLGSDGSSATSSLADAEMNHLSIVNSNNQTKSLRGRESGYGTHKSLVWESPPTSSGSSGTSNQALHRGPVYDIACYSPALSNTVQPICYTSNSLLNSTNLAFQKPFTEKSLIQPNTNLQKKLQSMTYV